jgi:hypothetical protein
VGGGRDGSADSRRWGPGHELRARSSELGQRLGALYLDHSLAPYLAGSEIIERSRDTFEARVCTVDQGLDLAALKHLSQPLPHFHVLLRILSSCLAESLLAYQPDSCKQVAAYSHIPATWHP